MPRVLNKHRDEIPPDSVYIGRPSKWGNPFSHQSGTLARFKVASRDEAVSAYENWLATRPDFMDDVKRELRSHDLVCFCAPLKCHGTILLKVANE